MTILKDKLREMGKNTLDFIVYSAVVIGILGGVVAGGSCLENGVYKSNCRERIAYYYKSENPNNYCSDPCIAKNTQSLIDIYQGKIDLQDAYKTAKEKCKK